MTKASLKTGNKAADRLRHRFGSLLADARRSRGFKTAYAFFHQNGATKGFGFTFQQYVRVEKGLRLPSEEGLGRIFDALFSSSALEAATRNELLVAFLRALVGGSELFENMFRELEASATEPPLPTSNLSEEVLSLATKRDHSDSAMMSSAQWKAVIASDVNFWVFQWLLRTGLSQNADQVARELSLPVAEVERALAILTNHELLRRKTDGTWSCPHFESDLSTPAGSIGGRDNARRLWSHMDRRLESPDTARYNSGFVVLALERPGVQYPKLVSLMSEALWKCYLFRQGRRPFHGALVSVEYRLTAPATADIGANRR